MRLSWSSLFLAMSGQEDEKTREDAWGLRVRAIRSKQVTKSVPGERVSWLYVRLLCSTV